MNFIFSFLIATIFIFGTKSVLKKYSKTFYIGATLIAVTVACISILKIELDIPFAIRAFILPIFSKSAFATALFVYVMYANAVPAGHKIMKTIMPIRAELSIIASILTLGHNVFYGISYFPTLFLNPSSLRPEFLYATLCSLVLIIIMLPLFITSFPKYRKKMNAKSWKQLQRLAYLFYALVYVHVLILTIPSAINGILTAQINILVYSIVFITYGVLRINKALAKKAPQFKLVPQIIGVCTLLIICYTSVMSPILTAIASSGSSTYEDGNYSGKGLGYNDYIYVDVTVANGAIAEIKVTKHIEDEPYYSDSKKVINDILETQSLEVDVVSGATYSSLGIIDGVLDALNTKD